VPEGPQGGSLARTHEGKPGLPRGRNRLPTLAVSASQRERLERAVIAAVAEAGYASATVADIVRRARVSRVAFYAHFRGKDDCFLSATSAGGQLLLRRVVTMARTVPDDAPVEDALRAGCGAFLSFLSEEPAFARVFYIDMPAAGPAAVERLHDAMGRFAEINRKGHGHGTRSGPPFPPRRTWRWPARPASWSARRSAPTAPRSSPTWRTPWCPCTCPCWPPGPGAPSRGQARRP